MYRFETAEHRFPEINDYPFKETLMSYYYGTAHDAAKYCGFDQIPYIPRGQWIPGWPPEFYNYHPAAVINDNGECEQGEYHWLLRKDQEDYLRSEGYKNAKAIGSAFLYTEDPKVPRLPNSLLVVPIHSLYNTTHDWNFEAYAEAIAKIRHEFDHVAVSVHPACMGKRYWIDPFEKLDCEIVMGARATSTTALLRQKWLYSRFEYLTTNIMGTQVAYGAYCGTKVSIYGPYMMHSKEDIETLPLFQRNPGFLEKKIELCKEESLRKSHGFLFKDHPKDAVELVDFGKHELGYDSMCTPEELRHLFCWPESKDFKSIDDLDTASIPKDIKIDSSKLPEKPTAEIYADAREGDLCSQLYLSLAFESGLADIKKDAEQAYIWARSAAEQGNVEAMLRTARFLILGEGIEQNGKEARSWIKLANDRGEAVPAEYSALLT